MRFDDVSKPLAVAALRATGSRRIRSRIRSFSSLGVATWVKTPSLSRILARSPRAARRYPAFGSAGPLAGH